MNKKKMIIISAGILFLVIIASFIILYFTFFYRMSSDNKNGKLILELTPDFMKVGSNATYESYRATIYDENNNKIISRKTLHVRFDKKVDDIRIDYGKWEISKYKFKYEPVEECSSFFILSSCSEKRRLVLYADIVKELENNIGIKILNPIEELLFGQEYQFEFDYYPKENYTLTWREVNDRKDEKTILQVDNNGKVKAINYGEATLYIEVHDKKHRTILQESINITVPYNIDRLELTIEDEDKIYSTDKIVALAINYYPDYATNINNYTITSSNPEVLDISYEKQHGKYVGLIPKSVGQATITVTTDTGVSASINVTVH